MDTTPNENEVITPSSILQYTDEQIDIILDGIRNRRMIVRQLFEKTMKLKELATHKKMEANFNKSMEKLEKELEKFDKYIAKLEKHANEVRVLRLQLGETME